MENKNPDVKFILEALVGSLLALTTEAEPLLEDEKGGQLRTQLTRSRQKSSSKIIRVLRLDVTFGNPRSAPSDGNIQKQVDETSSERRVKRLRRHQ